MSEKLQKVLARAGIGSRREMERWIEAGRIDVNGDTATLGDRVTAKDRIQVDGNKIEFPIESDIKTRVILYHKPEGEICTRSDPEGRPTVFERLPRLNEGRWVAIGRLDFNTTGVLLFTNNGELANRLMHPSSNIEREYAVRVLGEVTPDMIDRLKKGVTLEDGKARFKTITKSGGEGANTWYHVTLTEGKNREVRRLWESQNVKISRLMRVKFGKTTLPKYLKPGKWKELENFQL